MTNSQQTELDATRLWTNPPSWRSRMEQDAFELAFPDEERIEGDKVTVSFEYYAGTEPHGCEFCGFDSGSPEESTIEVRWSVPNSSRFNPANSRPGHKFLKERIFEKEEALKFWLDLMRKGAE